MQNNFLLSICIPTLNRAKYLEGIIENFLKETIHIENHVSLRDLIQLVVVDGASKDNTSLIIKKYQSECNLKYFKRNKRVGIDLDIIECVKISDSKYTWLMSDDDLFMPNSIRYLFNFLKDNEVSGCFLNRTPYDFFIQKKVAEVKKWPGKLFSKNHFFNDKDECFTKIGMDFGFISSQVFNREIFLKTLNEIKYEHLCDTYYLMVHVIASIMNKNFRWVFIKKNLVIQRTGNDSLLLSKGLYERQFIEHQNFKRIIEEHYDKKSKIYYKFFNKMVRRLPRVVANFKSQNVSYKTQIKILKLHFKLYSSYIHTWTNVIPIFLVPNFVFVIVKKIYFNLILK